MRSLRVVDGFEKGKKTKWMLCFMFMIPIAFPLYSVLNTLSRPPVEIVNWLRKIQRMVQSCLFANLTFPSISSDFCDVRSINSEALSVK